MTRGVDSLTGQGCLTSTPSLCNAFYAHKAGSSDSSGTLLEFSISLKDISSPAERSHMK